MATAAGTTETKESREQEKTSHTPIVVVDLDEPQSPLAVRRLRKGKGKLFGHVERIVKDLVEDGTIKANAQPLVIVVQEVPAPPWAFWGFNGDDE